MIHNSKRHLMFLTTFILENVTNDRRSFTISPVKADGTVFLNFKSNTTESASELGRRFSSVMVSSTMPFVATTPVQFRFALNQF